MSTHPLASVPAGPVRVPTAVRVLAAGRPTTCVWENAVGGLTFRLGDGPGREFAKWAPAGAPLDLAGEERRLRWAGTYVRVPRVVASGRDREGSWLVTAGLPGDSAVAERWLADPATAVRAAGEGLRALHDALPVDDCPFDWWRDPPGVPPADRLVVCHGDACVPNTLVGDDGRWSGHVDLDSLGVADRWADLAVGSWSTVWNYGPGWEPAYFEAYGIDPDPDRTAFYRHLWDPSR